MVTASIDWKIIELATAPLVNKDLPEHVRKEGLAIRDKAMKGDEVSILAYQDWLKDYDEDGDFAFWMMIVQRNALKACMENLHVPSDLMRGGNYGKGIFQSGDASDQSPSVDDPEVR